MKSNLLFTIILFFTTTYCFGQFSISSGLTVPIGSFANVDEGAANPGYQIAVSYDIKLNPKYGISTGLLGGESALKNKPSGLFDQGKWTFALIEVGAYAILFDNLKIKGLISGGLFGSPAYNFESVLAYSRKNSLGLDLRVEYSFGKLYLGSSFLYANPEFEIRNRNPIRQTFSNIAFNVGYIF